MRKLILICVMVLFSSIIADQSVYALPAFYKMFKTKYKWTSGCNVCHFSKKGGDSPNPYGRAFLHNGMNLSTFTRIEKTDSDKDGFSNIAELIARSYPGDAASTPENVKTSLVQPESDEGLDLEDDDVFSFEDVEQTEDTSDSEFLGGAFSNLIFGGALDIRRITRGQDMIPDRDNWDSGTTLIHVAEFVVTTSVGDHVSILGEQLLTTSPLGTQVADDHGFVYAILTGIPVLPKGASLKIGRFRHGFGIDTKSDAAANPLYNLVRKNIGFISDRGLQLNGFVGPVSYVLSLADGPDSLRTVTDGTVTSGIRIGPHGSGGGILRPIRNNSLPVFVHLNGTLPVFGKRFWLGGSYFDGNSYPFNAINGDVNPSTLVYKRRLGLATSFKVWKFDLAAEWVRGRDTELLKYLSSPIPSEDRNATVEGFYFHVELPLNESLDIRLKYDVWNPDRDLFSTFSFDREPEEPTWSTLGGALTWHFSEGALARIVYQVNNVEKPTRSAAIVPQLLVEF
ncbi:hypothetical protein F4X73_12210 [Candidatus Poribacteria bacterium]|nr:hypothetical protein [Candidatus Poribacteria bacterium]MYB65446.1 hypothetical protein [Candidatus Poribacteria bacterium]